MKGLSIVGAFLITGIGCRDVGDENPNNGDPEFGVCGHAVPPSSNPMLPTDATPEDIAATPRENPNLEALALRTSGGFIADQGIYDRMVADIGAIRLGAPELDDIHYMQANSAATVKLFVDLNTSHAMQTGNYTAWDELNNRYGVIEIKYHDLTDTTRIVEVHTKGLYDTDLLAAEYDSLPGVTSSAPYTVLGDWSTICADIDNQTFHYLFDRAWGDCPAGCIEHHVTYYKCEPNQTPQLLGEWKTEPDPVPNPEPEWLERFSRDCY